MRWFSALGTLLLATALNGLPAFPDSNAETVPTVIVEDATPSTELQPAGNNTNRGAKKHQKIYLINVYSVTLPGSDESFESDDHHDSVQSEEGDYVDDETLVLDLVEKMPEILDPVASVLLLVEEGAEDIPVDMEFIAKDLEAKGYPIEKFAKDGKTRVILLDFLPDDNQDNSDEVEDTADRAPKDDFGVDLIKPIETNMIKVRRKRAPCLKCYVDNLLPSNGGYRGNGYGQYGQYGYPDYGRGGYHGGNVGTIPVVVVPVDSGARRQYPSGGGGQYPSGGGRGYRPGSDVRPCNGCQVQRGGGWSTSSAQASSQSASGNW